MSVTENPRGVFYCERCCTRFDSGGDCPRCPEEPLLNLADEDVRRMLSENDERARHRRYASLLFGSALASVPIWFFSSILVTDAGGIAVAGLFAVGLTSGLMKLFPPRQSAPTYVHADIEILKLRE